MKIAVIGLLALIACSSPAAPPSTPSPTLSASSTPAVTACGNPSEHIYNPDRLRLLAPCVVVRGVILSVRAEPDGDDHIRLRVDGDQRDPRGGRFVNAANDAHQGGALILEPVCEHAVTQADAVAACAGYHNELVVPAVGSHVAATGVWVLDTAHLWTELHPLVRLVAVP